MRYGARGRITGNAMLQDCAICAFCCLTGPCWIVPRKRENLYLNGGSPARWRTLFSGVIDGCTKPCPATCACAKTSARGRNRAPLRLGIGKHAQ